MENIELDYPLIVLRGEGEDREQLHAHGAEVFMDEFGVEWVKFRPTNGYQRGKEHMVRTDQVVIVREQEPHEPRRSRA